MSKKYLALVLLVNLVFGFGEVVIFTLLHLGVSMFPIIYVDSVIFILFLTLLPPVVILFNLLSTVFALFFLRPFDYYTKAGFWISIIYFICLVVFGVATVELKPA